MFVKTKSAECNWEGQITDTPPLLLASRVQRKVAVRGIASKIDTLEMFDLDTLSSPLNTLPVDTKRVLL